MCAEAAEVTNAKPRAIEKSNAVERRGVMLEGRRGEDRAKEKAPMKRFRTKGNNWGNQNNKVRKKWPDGSWRSRASGAFTWPAALMTDRKSVV